MNQNIGRIRRKLLLRAVSLAAALFSCFAVLPSCLSAGPWITKGDVPAESGFRIETLIQGLAHPWSMAWMPNGDMLIAERPGRLRLVQNGHLVPDPLPGIPDVLAAGQGGLLDVCLHPQFVQNRTVYFTYAHGTRTSNRTRLAAARFNGTAIENWRVLFEVSDAKAGRQHFGSRMLWLPGGTLLVSIGDGGNPPIRLKGDWIRVQAQNRQSHLGKILRLQADGSPPDDNPYYATGGLENYVWSYGHRNVQGLAYDRLRDMVWATEHGALGGDELNHIRRGANYGWPLATFSREYIGGGRISAHTTRPGNVDPAAVWMTAIAPSGLAVYTGSRFAHWHGDLFVAGLKSQDIRRIELNDAGEVTGQTALRIGQRVRDVRQGPDELLYVLTDESDGQLLRLHPAGDHNSPEPP